MKAKEVIVEKWINTTENFSLNLADGKIKYIHFFQMLCTGCVYYGIPQTAAIYEKYNSEKFQVLAIHSVFEHHEAMNENALRVFIHEWKLKMPIGIDKILPGEWMPLTMKTHGLQGTPTTIVIDGQGELRLNTFGHLDTHRLCDFLDNLIQENNSAIPLKI